MSAGCIGDIFCRLAYFDKADANRVEDELV